MTLSFQLVLNNAPAQYEKLFMEILISHLVWEDSARSIHIEF